ncbi:glutamyl-tRNA amidotransferase [Candidatus Campbellbacteria bacterium CG22_combo_CG10-13_8_21_14_all_36_13]|uniref:Glutamyl-tRNA amidotransferase n=1 Tax=Candidatus Campbellbacteria bacterium CG22_combo_CG10-13_8_21_14_all_36_13 TaxID=1974529 RepID=A0A2H0E099_9BACT|nr:MAG: glutamyl-tRNA amidotransferase [Candidatus Campbellbacteria bacterium CG22_combo_CG10-13_8_21_14_all_36_13]
MLHEQIQKEVQEAMKAREELKLSVLRGMLSSFTNELVATKRKPTEKLTDDEVIGVIRRLAKQRKESIEQFRAGNREDLASKEAEELAILETYLPKMMDIEEIKAIVIKKKEELDINDKSKMGILMGAIMKDLKGKADGNDVKNVIESIF